MKRTLRGRLYDTDSATLIGEYTNSALPSEQFTEQLYIKKTGEFFLYGKGGPDSKYNKFVRNTYYPNEKIIPLSYDQADKWATAHLSNIKYNRYFGDIAGDDIKQIIRLDVNAATVNKIKRLAYQHNMSSSKFIIYLIDEIYKNR